MGKNTVRMLNVRDQGATQNKLLALVVLIAVPVSASEWGPLTSLHLMEQQDTFGDPFHQALNSLPHWMDDSIETHTHVNASMNSVDDTQLRFYLPSPISTGNVSSKCRWDVEQIINAQKSTAVMAALAQKGSYWPTLIPDSWGKLPDGMLSGNLVPLGMMEECTYIRANDQIDNTTLDIHVNATFNGQYCMIFYGKHGPPLPWGADPQVTQGGRPHILGHIPSPRWGAEASYGTCMPDSCSAQDFKISLDEVLTDGNEVFWTHCHTKDETQIWEAKDYAFVSVMGFIGILVVLAAAVDLAINYLGEQELRKFGPARYLLVFSCYSNMSKIFHIDIKENPRNIACLHGMRVLSMTWVIWGHQSSMVEVENILDIRYIFEDVIGQTIMNAQLSVDSFFFLSGLLVAYGLMKSKDKMDIYNFVMFYVHRFLRLAPPIAAMCFFSATVARFFSTGPLGEANYLTNMDMCNENWIYDILFMNNLNMKMCVGQTWYTSVDMQIYVLVPLLFFPLMYYRKIGAAWLMFMTAVSIIIPAVISHIYELPLTFVIQPPEKAWDMNFLLYMGPWSRMTPYLVGLWTGYLIYKFNKNPLKMERWQVTLGWVTAIVVGLLVVYGIYPYNHYNESFGMAQEPDQLVSDIYTGCFRGAWGLALMWIVIACHTGYGGYVNSFLGHPSWQPLSRLTYGMFLVHIHVIMLISGSSFRLKYLTQLYIIIDTCGTLFISGIAAVVLSLLVESPIIGLEKLLLTRPGGEQKTATLKESQNKLKA